MVVNWRKWGFGFSVSWDHDEPWYLRLWLGPVRIGWSYGYEDDTNEG